MSHASTGEKTSCHCNTRKLIIFFFSLKLFSAETILSGAGLYCWWLPFCCCLHYFGLPSFTLLWLALLEQLRADLPSNTFLWVPEDGNILLQFTGKDSVEKIIKLHLAAGAGLLQAPVKCAAEQTLKRKKPVCHGFVKWKLPCTWQVLKLGTGSLQRYENVLVKEEGVTSWRIPEKLHPRMVRFSPMTNKKAPTG